MIYVDFNGRCGDQFFQYSFARKIQLHINNNEPLQFNFFNQERWRKKTGDDSFRNDLEHFNVVENHSYCSEIKNLDAFGSKRQLKLYKRYNFIKKVSFRLKCKFLARRYQKKLQKNGIYYEDEYFGFFTYPKNDDFIFIRGYFEDYKFYYEDDLLREALLKELTPKVVSFSNDDELLSFVKNNECVCVSLRSWKEVANDSETFSSRMICGEEYYKLALEKMLLLHPNKTLVVFSDDIEWAKKIIGTNYNAKYESGSNTIEEKIVLMSNCNHFIIANSSFSWWTQYLSKEANKTVVSPSRWYTDRDDNRVINPNWILINV